MNSHARLRKRKGEIRRESLNDPREVVKKQLPAAVQTMVPE